MAEQLQGVLTLDTFMNQMARTGYGSPNLMEGTQYVITRLTRDYNLMNALYRNNWVVRRIIDIIPKDMMKNGWAYTSEIKPEELDMIQKAERLTRIKPALLRGLMWGRLYGGAVGLMMIDGQENLEEPLDIESIMPGDFKSIMLVDRWSGVYPMSDLVEDISSPEFGLPLFYQVQDWTSHETYKVHHSRCLRFIGCDLPNWEQQAEMYWGSSVVESVYEEIKKRDNTSANIAGLIFLANLRVLRMADLGEILAGTNKKTQQSLYNTLTAQNMLQSNFGVYVMSKDDEFQSIRTTFEGLDSIYECFMMDVSGAAQIPMTKLFGRSPAGLNATGESDLRNYNSVVEQEQEANLRPVLEKLVPVLFMSTLGYVPEDIDVAFNPVHTPTDEELGNLVKWKTEAVMEVHDRGIVSDQVALKELKQFEDTTGMWTNITDEDIASAESKPRGQMMQEAGESLPASGGMIAPGGGDEDPDDDSDNNEDSDK